MKQFTITIIIGVLLMGLFVIPSSAAGSAYYQVRQGDTLWGVAVRNNTTVLNLLDMNPGITPDNLRVGQQIRVPGATLSRIHVVEAKETLWGIAKLHGVSLESLMELNQLYYDSVLLAGQRLVIPLPGQVTTVQYIVKPGDSYWSLAAKHNTTVDYLVRLNGMVAPENLQVNTMVRLPVVNSVSQPKLHTVKSGETLYRIAGMYQTTVANLLSLNTGLQPEGLRVGQRLVVGK